MSKKVKVLISVLAAVLLLTIGTATAVMAQDNGSTANTTGANGLLARVAGNLGISQGELTDAFQQARQEMREEAFLRAVERAEEKGLIDGDEADEIREWWEQRPEAINRFQRALRFGMWRAHRGWHRAGTPEMAD